MTERDPNQPTGEPPTQTPTPSGYDSATPTPTPTPTPSSDDTPMATATPPPSPSTDETPTEAWKAPAWTPAASGAVDETPRATPAEPVRAARGNGLRWGIALLVTVLVIGLGAAAFVLLTGQTAPSSLVGYAPANSLVYGEVRLDLPGDQRQKLGQFLSKFPGFKDQANLSTKYDEVLDRVVLALTSNQQDFTNNIKPWFGGELGFGVGDLPVPTGATPDMSDVRVLALVSVTDAAKAREWLDGILGDVTRTTADHNGTQLVLVGDGPARVATGIHGKVMLIGDEASVRAAIDTNGAGQLAKSERYAAALGAVPGDSLGYFYVDFGRYVDWLAAAAEAAPEVFGIQIDEAYRKLLPEWGVARLQARGDAIAMEFVSPHVESALKLANRAGELAPHLPPSTIVLVDGHDMGDGLLQTIEMYRTNPGTAEAFKQIDQVAVLLGGFDRIVGWIRDGGFALTKEGDKVDGGLVFSPKDRAGGERLLATLRSYAVIGGGQAGLQVEVRDEPYAGTTISTIDFGDWRDLAAMGGADASSIPFEGRFEIAYAATDEVIVIGLGDSFVKAVVDAKPGASLADDARYKALIDRVGASNVGSAYLDITAVREMFESLFKSADPTGFGNYEREIQPYLEPLDAYVQSSVLDGALDRSVGLVVVK